MTYRDTYIDIQRYIHTYIHHRSYVGSSIAVFGILYSRWPCLQLSCIGSMVPSCKSCPMLTATVLTTFMSLS